MKKFLLAIASVALLAGCTLSTSPAISTTDSEGNYVVLTNQQTALLGIVVSNKNEAVKCNTVSGKCELLTLTNEDGESLR